MGIKQYKPRTALVGNIYEFEKLLNSISPGKGTEIVERLITSEEYKPMWYGNLSLEHLLVEDQEFVLDYCPNFREILWEC